MCRYSVLLVRSTTLCWSDLHNVLASKPDLQLLDEPRALDEAVQLAIRHQPNLVIVPTTMSDASILPFLSSLRQIHVPDTAIIAIATEFDPEEFRQLAQLGVEGYFMWTELTHDLVQHGLAAVLAGFTVVPTAGMHAYREAQRTQVVLPGDPIQLTANERRVVKRLAEGMTRGEIAHAEGMAERTIARNVASLQAKLEVESLFALGVRAAQLGLIS